MKKIIDETFIKKKIDVLKNKNKKIGLCHGVFDLLHIGHINHISEAKNKCDILIISVTHNDFIHKGPGRPAFNHNVRMQALSALENVDYVFLSKNQTAQNSINLIKPDLYFKGPDYKNHLDDISGEITNEIKTLKKIKGKIYYTKSKKFSSSNLINQYLSTISDEQKKAIDKIKKKFTFTDIEKLIDNLKHVNPLVIGEIIIDQYVFSEALGKSGKEPVLVLKQLDQKKYLGGAGAICNNLSNFCKKINFLSMIGEKSEEIGFIRKKLSQKVKYFFLKKKNSPTIIKKRFIDKVNKHKVFGVYSLEDELLHVKDENLINSKFKDLSKKTNLSIVSDYGHGFLSKSFIKKIIKNSKFVAANVQINAANIGFHTLINYQNIDFLIINESEIRHEMRSRNEDLKILIRKLAKSQKIKYLVVTRGVFGSIFFEKKTNSFFYTDAFEKAAKDKVGAGDTMLSISALCLAQKVDFDLTMLISSLCAAQNVKVFANESPIDKKKLLKELKHILS